LPLTTSIARAMKGVPVCMLTPITSSQPSGLSSWSKFSMISSGVRSAASMPGD